MVSRDAVFDWTLPFLGAALFVFRDFMERVDIVWAPLVRGAGIDARTTQSPAHREASPECFTGWPCPPAGTHSNASFAAEVQSIFEPRHPGFGVSGCRGCVRRRRCTEAFLGHHPSAKP